MKAFLVILLLILSYFTWKPLLHSGYFSMHDDQQVVRLQQLDKSLTAGQFPVRIVEDLGFGMGYPVFNFYPPFIYYLGEIFHLVGFGFIDSIKIVWCIALVGSAISMYFLSREFFGKFGALASSIFYLYAPYHAVDAYVRGALAELFSFVWLPLILLFSYKRKFVLTAFFLSLLMVTHNLIFLPFVGIYVLWNLFLGRKYFVRSLLALALTLVLTAFFWLPALYEKQFTLVDQLLIKNLASYTIHFVCPIQLWSGFWGYGGSVSGCFDGMSFAIGKIHIVCSCLAAFIFLFKRKYLYILAILLFCIFMTLDYSKFIWDRIPQLWYLQFPWRFLEFIALFSSLSAGAIFLLFRNKYINFAIACILVTGTIFLNAKHFVPQTFYSNTTDAKLTTNEQIKWNVSSSSFEYLPKGIATKINELGVVWIDIDKSEIRSSKIETIVGDFTVQKQEFLPHKFSVLGNSKNGATIQFNISNFVGWKIWIDGQETRINDNNKYKLITTSVDVGTHEIVGEFTNTPVRSIGNTISVGGLLLLGYLLWKLKKSNQEQ